MALATAGTPPAAVESISAVGLPNTLCRQASSSSAASAPRGWDRSSQALLLLGWGSGWMSRSAGAGCLPADRDGTLPRLCALKGVRARWHSSDGRSRHR